jgi:hypothetical protein
LVARKGLGTALLVGLSVALALMTVLQEEESVPPALQDTASEHAVSQEKTSPPPVRAAAPATVKRAQTQVGLDPTTGRLLPPSPAQRKSLADALRQQFASAPRAPDYFADGTISVVVGTERLNFSVARINERGLPEMNCVSGLEQAVTVLEMGGHSVPLRAEE